MVIHLFLMCSLELTSKTTYVKKTVYYDIIMVSSVQFVHLWHLCVSQIAEKNKFQVFIWNLFMWKLFTLICFICLVVGIFQDQFCILDADLKIRISTLRNNGMITWKASIFTCLQLSLVKIWFVHLICLYRVDKVYQQYFNNV